MQGASANALLPDQVWRGFADRAYAPPGAWCSCCWGTRWWTERYKPKGWRCVTCPPPKHLRLDQIWINDRPALPPFRKPTGTLL